MPSNAGLSTVAIRWLEALSPAIWRRKAQQESDRTQSQTSRTMSGHTGRRRGRHAQRCAIDGQLGVAEGTLGGGRRCWRSELFRGRRGAAGGMPSDVPSMDSLNPEL